MGLRPAALTGVRIKTLVPLYETLRERERYRYAISRGFRPATFLLTTKLKFGGGAKTPIIQTLSLYETLKANEYSLAAGAIRFFGQKTLLLADS